MGIRNENGWRYWHCSAPQIQKQREVIKQLFPKVWSSLLPTEERFMDNKGKAIIFPPNGSAFFLYNGVAIKLRVTRPPVHTRRRRHFARQIAPHVRAGVSRQIIQQALQNLEYLVAVYLSKEFMKKLRFTAAPRKKWNS